MDTCILYMYIHTYDDVTYAHDDVTYAHDDVTYACPSESQVFLKNACMYIHTYIYTHVYIHVYMGTCILYMYIHTCMYAIHMMM